MITNTEKDDSASENPVTNQEFNKGDDNTELKAGLFKYVLKCKIVLRTKFFFLVNKIYLLKWPIINLKSLTLIILFLITYFPGSAQKLIIFPILNLCRPT